MFIRFLRKYGLCNKVQFNCIFYRSLFVSLDWLLTLCSIARAGDGILCTNIAAFCTINSLFVNFLVQVQVHSFNCTPMKFSFFLSSQSKIHTAAIGCFKALMNSSVSITTDSNLYISFFTWESDGHVISPYSILALLRRSCLKS